MIDDIKNAIHQIKVTKPLILNLTNYVTMDFMANVLLALGAAPIMSVSNDELDELIAMCSAINLNIGTLDNAFIERALSVIKLAHKYNKPIVFDPVGAGATIIRTEIAKTLVKAAEIVRGNASEVMALNGVASNTKGVEAMNTTDNAKEAAYHLAKSTNSVVVVSGAVDFITDGIQKKELHYGSPIMPLITGMGCALTAVIAAFRGVVKDPFLASNLAVQYYGMCGQIASQRTGAPGKFRSQFIDCIYTGDFKTMQYLEQEEYDI